MAGAVLAVATFAYRIATGEWEGPLVIMAISLVIVAVASAVLYALRR
jgi:hypothetical protein